MEKVAVQRCNTYNLREIETKLKEAVDLLGGMNSFIKPGQQVLLKVNLLMAKPPEKAVTTHPALVKAVGKMVQQAGGKVIIGDTTGGLFSKKGLERHYRISGIMDAAVDIGAELAYQLEEEKVTNSEGVISKSFVLAKFATEADVIINLPKLKTHGLTMYTGAVKNLFGLIPGMLKKEYHLSLSRTDHFTEMLLDLADLTRPVLNIMDAVTGMEGDGPSGGKPRDFNYLLASSSALALDAAGIYLLGINPGTKTPLLAAAKTRGRLSDIGDVQLLGDQLLPAREVDVPSVEKTSDILENLPGPVHKMLGHFFRARPSFDHEKCIGCGDCYQNCPAQIIEMIANRPVVDLENCIRCFCCQEFCQYQAVDIKRPLAGRLIFR